MTDYPPMKIKVSREETGLVRDLSVTDLWHLAAAIPKVTEAITLSKERMIDGDYERAELRLGEAPSLDGERAREEVLGVWHLAHNGVRALHQVEARVHEALQLVDEASSLVDKVRLHAAVNPADVDLADKLRSLKDKLLEALGATPDPECAGCGVAAGEQCDESVEH